MSVDVRVEIGECAPVIPKTARVVIHYGDCRAETVWTYASSLTVSRGATNDRYTYVTTREDGSSTPGTVEVRREESGLGYGYTPDAGPLQRAVANYVSRVLVTVLAVDAAAVEPARV